LFPQTVRVALTGTLWQQQVTKEVAQVAIVWFVIEGNGTGVFKEGLKLGWKPVAQGRCRGFDKDVRERLKVIAPS
jgi:hypothetical protein